MRSTPVVVFVTTNPSTLPVNALLFKSSCVIPERVKSSIGSAPVRELKSRSKKIRLGNSPICEGMRPVRPPRSMPQRMRSVSKPISVGIVPMRSLSSNSTSVTHPTTLHAMPAHSHSLDSPRKRFWPMNGDVAPQDSSVSFAEHAFQLSPFVEKYITANDQRCTIFTDGSIGQTWRGSKRRIHSVAWPCGVEMSVRRTGSSTTSSNCRMISASRWSGDNAQSAKVG
mmetsp:Transcript_9202/g.26288  ORF Transcript_9202/g.26288 Transcript_9202/m.26288 type:complete len:226 (+) Transcript_9202:429-1106(+)